MDANSNKRCFCFFWGYNCQYSENEQKLNHQCGRKCKIIDKGEESVGEVGTDDEIDVIILRMNLLNY